MNDKENAVRQETVVKEELLDLQPLFENIAKKEGYITYEITATKINSGGANFLGVLFEVDIKGKSKDGQKETHLFLKKAIDDGIFGNVVGESNFYVTEYFVYQDLAKRLHELQIEAKVPEEERYKIVKCYESPDPTTIILENMAKKGYKTPHRMEVVSLKYAELCMEQLAKFHALSFALKVKDPDYFENKLRHMKCPFTVNENTKALCEMSSGMITKNLDPINKAKAEKILEVYIEKHMQYMNSENSPVTCLCHGDFRASNILMKENEDGIMEVIPVDYQCVYIGCPLLDFLYFISCGTDRKFRVQNLENLKTLYYDTLTRFLKYFDIDSNDVFPRKKMDEIFDQSMDYVTVVAMFSFAFMFAPDNTLDGADVKEAEVELDERYKERLIEILEDFPL